MKRGDDLYNIKEKPDGKDNISPIRKYQIDYCLSCEEQGKCDHGKMQLCAVLRLLDLKEYQMMFYSKKFQEEIGLPDEGMPLMSYHTFVENIRKKNKFK